MNLTFNTESLRPPLTGIGYYAYNLIRELTALAEVEHINCFNGANWMSAEEQLTLVAEAQRQTVPPSVEKKIELRQNVRTLVRGLPLAYPLRAALLNRRFSKGIKNMPGGVYHEPNFILKPCRGPSVVTVHDLSFLHYPQYHPRERVAWLTRELPKTLKRADMVITDSEVVRIELMERFKLPEERTKTIYLGADARFTPRDVEQTTETLKRYGLEHQRYVLFVGTLEPRKGLATLLDAWLLLPEILRKEYPLAIAGASGWRNTELIARIESLHEQGCIRFLEYVSSDDLPILYSGATTFVYPSVYEGFGLPVLEAMASGVPVICTAGTSMDEFSAGSCILCHTSDCNELSESLKTLLENKEIRDCFILKGLKRAESFSWKFCAQETAEVYRYIAL